MYFETESKRSKTAKTDIICFDVSAKKENKNANEVIEFVDNDGWAYKKVTPRFGKPFYEARHKDSFSFDISAKRFNEAYKIHQNQLTNN